MSALLPRPTRAHTELKRRTGAYATAVSPLALLLMMICGGVGCEQQPCSCEQASTPGCGDVGVQPADVSPDAGAQAPDARPLDAARDPDLRPEGDPDVYALDGATPPDGAAADGGDGAVFADAGWPEQQESEPNDGEQLDEFNDLASGVRMRGTISSGADADIYRIAAEAGRVYAVQLTVSAGSSLRGHLTVIDAGRDGDAPGQDYVKLARAPDGPSAHLSWLAMGVGGYFVAVRDERAVGGDGEGGPEHTYALHVTELSIDEAGVQPLPLPADLQGQLEHPGGVVLYSFDAEQGDELRFDLRAQPRWAFDGRLTVWSGATGDWVARNDNRALDDTDPLIAAPLMAAGPLLLVVDNTEEAPDALTYRLLAGP